MKKILLSAALVLGFAPLVSAITPAANLMTEKQAVVIKNVKSGSSAQNSSVKKLAPGVSISVNNGIKKLNVIGKESKTIDINRTKSPLKSTLPEGYVLYESFEDWDGDDVYWTPDGWTVDMRGDVDRDESWTPSSEIPFAPSPSDGEYFYGINFSYGDQDEWLISPFVTVGEGMDLSYWLYLDPAFLFNLDNVDWDTFDWIGDREVAATLQIWAQEEGGEWVMLRDYFDEYQEYSLMELLDMTPESMEKNTVSLSNYYGKSTRVAFRYVGTDGNTMFIDAIGIGYPALDDVVYSSPLETLYWGFERTPNLTGLGAAIAQYPVYSPIVWENMSAADAEFTWTYCDPATGEFVSSNEPEMLIVTYEPDYSSDASKKNNLFYPPTLRGEAPHSTPGEYTAPYVYFQAGGKPEITLDNGSEFNASLMPFNYHELGIAITTVSDDELGDFSIPVFGHSPNTDKYWLNYSLNGETPQEGDYSRLTGIANLYVPPREMPLVANGVTVFGYGKIGTDAQLKATIYALNSEWSSDFSTFEVIATASISGADVLSQDENEKSYLCLPFDFETPAVIQSTEDHPAYFIMLEGFDSDSVEYFAPIQSQNDDYNFVGQAYIMMDIDLSNHIDREPYISIKRAVYKDDGEYYDPNISFAIALDAEYPWLRTDCEGINFRDGFGKVVIGLESYYDASKLTVTAPAGLTASVSGRYNDCILTVDKTDAAVVAEGDVVVEGPGVKISIPIDLPGGISLATSISSTVVNVYDLTGAEVNKDGMVPGIYILRFADGSMRKVMVK